MSISLSNISQNMIYHQNCQVVCQARLGERVKGKQVREAATHSTQVVEVRVGERRFFMNLDGWH